MSDEFESLAEAGADVLVRAMASDAWEGVKGLYSRLTRGREQQVARTREVLSQSASPGQPAVRDREAERWKTRLRDEMDDDADLADEIRRVLAAQPTAIDRTLHQDASGAAAPVQQAVASDRSNITQVTAPGGRNIRINSPDQRRYRFSLPFVPVFLQKIVSEHVVVSSVIAVLVIGGVTGGAVVATRSHDSEAPSVWGSYTVIDGPADTGLAAPVFSPSGDLLAAVTGSDTGQVVVLNLAKKNDYRPVEGVGDAMVGWPESLSFDSSGDLLAAVTDRGQQVALINTSDWSVAKTINSPVADHSRWLSAMYVPATGTYIALCDGTSMYFYSGSDYQLTWTMPVHSDPYHGNATGVDAFTISPSGKILATGGSVDSTIALWDINSGQQTGAVALPVNDAAVEAIAYSPDSKYIAAVLYNEEVVIWSMEAKRIIGSRPLPPVSGPRVGVGMASLEFSPNGKTLMVANGSNIYLYTVIGL